MADWSLPILTSTYTNVLDYLKARDVDAMTLFVSAGTNIPTSSIRYNRGTNLFEEWDGAAWGVKTLAIAGGGTGATSAAGARTALGLGTMATQNANAVAITGGTLAGITSLSLSGNIIAGVDDSYAIGTNAARFQKAYFRTGFVLPSGTDKYLTS